MKTVWDYFTPEQQDRLSARIKQFTEAHGPEEVRRLRKESDELVTQLRNGLETGRSADTPEIVALAERLARSQALFDDGDPEIAKAIQRFHAENPDQKDHGIDLMLYRYIEDAKSHINGL